MNKRILILLLIAALGAAPAFAVTKTFLGGTWWIGGSWSPAGDPIAGDYVIIPAGTTCTVNGNTNIIDGIEVSGTLNFVTGNASCLKFANNFTIYSTGLVNNTGSIEKTVNGGMFTISGNGTYIHNPFNNVLLDESIFYRGDENFSITSNITIMKWFDISIPVGHSSRVAMSNFGNLTLSVNTTGLRWNQRGCFSVSRIQGTFNITDGIILMDDGQGFTTQLVLTTVNISNNGSLIIRTGAAPSFTLTTGAFNDLSNSIFPTVLADTTFCLFTWNASSSVQLGHYFMGMVGSGLETGGDLRINVTGNLTISGTSSCQFVTQCDAPLRLNVTGNTTIGGTPVKVRFVDGNSGLLNFSTNDFIIAGGSDNILLGGGPPVVRNATGVPSITINNDFLINGASSSYILKSDSNTNKLRISVGRDFIMSNTNALFVVSKHPGAQTFKTTRHLTVTGGGFTGQADTANVALDSLIVGSNFTFNSPVATNFFILNAGKGTTVIQTTGNFSVLASGTAIGQGVYGVYNGAGTLTMTVGGSYVQGPSNSQFNAIYNSKQWVVTGGLNFNVTGTFDQNGGIFIGVNAPDTSTSNTINFTVNSVDFDGGYFSGFHTANNASATATFNITNTCKVNFATALDTFMFVGKPYAGTDFCYLSVDVNIGGSLIISGANGAFVSSYAKNREVFDITGSVTISGGNNAFNPMPPLVSSTHDVYLNIGGSMTISGGTTVLSQLSDSVTVTINNDLVIAGGTLSVKARNGVGIVNVLDGFTMTGGNLFLHNNSSITTTDASTLTINSDGDATGNFTHTGGTITFDNFATGNPAGPQTIIVKSPSYTIGGNGVMTRNGTSITPNYWGALRFQRIGTTNFSRTSTTHNIQQVKQYIDNGTTVDVVSGDVQIASWGNTFSLDLLSILNTGTLALRGSSIKSNVTLPNSGITVFGRLRIQHPNGLYNNTSNAALDATGGMNYFLQVGSTVEYYGNANQVITGMNVGLANLSALHKYYKLDINMGGVAFAYPTNVPSPNSVYVRNRLNLLAGELNLDNDHVPTNGGRSIIIEDSTTAAITQTSGFIRSETQDGSGMVKWNIGRATGPHIFPFGYSLSVNDRIPFTFTVPSGDADTVSISTYHSNNSNLPYPPTVNHVRNNSGLDNSPNTVDRFWYINTTGTVTNANMTFSVLSTANGSSIDEMPAITTLRAQRWIAALNSWELAYQGTQSNPSANVALVTGATLFPNWWTLSGNNSPLPVQLLTFTGSCDNKNTCLRWTTATEVNNDYFTVIRSTDGVNYETIGTLEGHGNSTSTLSYKFVDENSISEYAYYKLIQTDFDGRSEEFGPLVVHSCKDNAGLDVVVTNSNTGNTNLLVHSSYSGKFRIHIFNSQGQLTLDTEAFISEGSNLVPLVTDKLSTGIYQVRLESDRDVVSKKVFISLN